MSTRREEWHRARWPLLLWLSLSVFPLAILAYTVLRIRSGGLAPGPKLQAALALSVVGLACLVAVPLFRAGRNWLTTHRFRLLLAIGTLWVGLGLLDIGLTLTGIVPTIAEQRRHAAEYEPGANVRHLLVPKEIERPGAAPLRINQRGLVGSELQPPPPGGLRLITLGGSHVFDFTGGGWPARMEERLREAGLPVQVLNAGVPAYTTADSLTRLVLDLWALEPDAVLLCHGWNDLKYLGLLDPETPYVTAMPAFRRDWRVQPRGLDRILSLSALYRMRRQVLINNALGAEGTGFRHPEATYEEFGLRQFDLNLRLFAEAAREVGALPILCRQARLPVEGLPPDHPPIRYELVGLTPEATLEAFRDLDRILISVAREKQVPLLDLHTPLSGRPEYFVDHIHFTPEGSAAAAGEGARRLEPILRPLLGGTSREPAREQGSAGRLP